MAPPSADVVSSATGAEVIRAPAPAALDCARRTRSSGEDGSETYPEPSIRAAYALITRTCLGAGLSAADTDDLAQDIWEWLIRTGVPVSVIATPWLKGAVHNYILRFRRRSYCRRVREGQSLASVPEPRSSPPLSRLESKELLDRVATALPSHERSLLALIRRGYSVAESARLLGIPRGSRAYHQGRLVACARRAMKRTPTPFDAAIKPRPAPARPSSDSRRRAFAARTNL
jgi:DNA-directed RNA polymerase specialized sigma24 family protein